MNELFNWSLDAVADWVTQLISPAKLISQCLQENAASGLRGVIKTFWVLPITISVALDAVLVFTAFGFPTESKTPAFALYVLYAFLKWFFGALIVSFLLRLFRQTAKLPIIIVCYSFLVIYAPVFSLLEAPTLYHEVWVVSRLRAEGLDLFDTLTLLIMHPRQFAANHVFMVQQASAPWTLVQLLLWQIESAVFMIVNVYVAENLVVLLINDRLKTYLAVWLASIISLLPITILNLVWIGVELRHTVEILNIPD